MIFSVIKKLKISSGSFSNIGIFIIPLVILVVVLSNSFTLRFNQHFSHLADAFLHGQVHFLSYPTGSTTDVALQGGQYYWPQGPLPSVLLMPFVALFKVFHAFFYQGYLQWTLILALFYIIVRLALKLRYSFRDSLILSFGFILGSMYIGVAAVSSSWFFAQVVTTLLLFWSILEFYGKRRWGLIGLICGLILLTRLSAILIIIFFTLEILQSSSKEYRAKYKKLAQVCAPLAVASGLWLLYNLMRFGSPLDQGYASNLTSPGFEKSRAYGIFSIYHIPSNLYYAFLSGPLPVFRDNASHLLEYPFIKINPWGMSIFLTSPYLLYLFSLKRKYIDEQTFRILGTVLVMMFIVFTFYGIGYYQFGYRYALDFLPLIFLLFMIKYKQNHVRLSTAMKSLILFSAVFNFYLLMTFI